MKQLPKIVIADDMQMMRRLLKTALVRGGFQDITEAMNGEELLKALDEDSYDIVICDWDMPRMSGIEALRHIRNSETHKDIPFVMVTAVAEANQVRQAIEVGISDYIIKPIKPEVFVDKIKKILTDLDIAVPVSA